MYIGLMLHVHTCKRDLVDRLYHLGMSISYDHVLRLFAQMGSNACKQFHQDHVICPLKLRSKVFTSAAVDNIDHNPTSTTSKQTFHGTGISLIQHPTFNGEGIDRSTSTEGRSVGSKSVDNLPHFYTEVPLVTNSIKKCSIPATDLTSLKRDGFKQQTLDYLWLHPTSLLPLFLESVHTVAMIKHSFCIVKSAVKHLNPGQTPVLTYDQPLYALAKQIQWTWPDDYGEYKFVIMFGGLHIEMAALKTIGDWLKGSSWVQALAQAEIATAGTADSFLRATHVTRTRRAHQVTVAALYILKHRAYASYCLSCSKDGQAVLVFKEWCHQKQQICPQVQYWSTVMELELCVMAGTDTGGVNWVASHPPLALKLNFCFILLKE